MNSIAPYIEINSTSTTSSSNNQHHIKTVQAPQIAYFSARHISWMAHSLVFFLFSSSQIRYIHKRKSFFLMHYHIPYILMCVPRTYVWEKILRKGRKRWGERFHGFLQIKSFLPNPFTLYLNSRENGIRAGVCMPIFG